MTLTKPNLPNLDTMFALGDIREVVELTHTQLQPFASHPFSLHEGERLGDLVESIRQNGVLTPILVRLLPTPSSTSCHLPHGGRLYEILAGHNRTHAANLAGLETVPAIVLEDLTDEQALAVVIQTNLMQRSFTDMKHSEKAAVLAMSHQSLFSKPKQLQIKYATENLDNGQLEENSQVANSPSKLAQVGAEYSLSKDTVARYIRLHKHLHKGLMALLDDGRIAFIPAVELSYLKNNEQHNICVLINVDKYTLDIKKAKTLHELSSNATEDIKPWFLEEIMSGKSSDNKSIRTQSVKLPANTYARYFADTDKKDVPNIIEAALQLYFQSELAEALKE